MSRTTHTSIVRSRGGSQAASPATMVAFLKCQVDPTVTVATAMTTTSGDTAKLPSGAIPLAIHGLGGATGGSAPTVDIGDGDDDDGFGAELLATTVVTHSTTKGALMGIALTADTTVYGMVGASAATGGTVTVGIEYAMSDNGGM